MLRARRKLVAYSYLAQKKIKRKIKRFSNRSQVQVMKDDDYDSHVIDDLQLTLSRDSYPGSKYEIQEGTLD